MKKIAALVLALCMIFALVACSSAPAQPAAAEAKTEAKAETKTEAKAEAKPAESKTEAAPAAEPASGEGKIFNIWTWNTEFWDFLCKYYADETIDEYTAKKGDVTIKRTTYPSDGLAYQNALDEALLAQADADDDDKVDMFLAEADYIIKYTRSAATQDVAPLGVTDFSNTYAYTVEAASDEAGVVKGVSFQCCPAAVIYRRSIAQDVIGTDDPAAVQEAISTWAKFNEVAAQAKEKGYTMIPSTNATYRVFSNNTTAPWVKDGKLAIDANIEAWMDQSAEFVEKGYTAFTSDIWGAETTSEMFKEGKSMCFFGPAWYYNFSMGNAQDPEKGCFGDWAICQGPQAFFWGGTWMLAAAGSDNPTMIAEIMNTFINDEDVCSKLVEEAAQFTNNQAVNAKYADNPDFGNAFLGGQNDTAIYVELAKNIKFQNQTSYDQACNEGLQKYFTEYLNGQVTREEAIQNFKDYMLQTYPNIVVD